MDEWRDGIKDEGLRKLRRKVSGAGHSYGHEDMDGWRDKQMDACRKLREQGGKGEDEGMERESDGKGKGMKKCQKEKERKVSGGSRNNGHVIIMEL